MELVIENLTEHGFKKVLEALEPQVAGVFIEKEIHTITCILMDNAEYVVHTTSNGTVIRKAEITLGSYKKQVVLKSEEYTRIIIQ